MSAPVEIHIFFILLRYGHEIARLTLAQAAVKKGNGIARKGGVNPVVVQDIKVGVSSRKASCIRPALE